MVGSATSLGALGLVTLVGAVFAFGGYGIAGQLVAWTGWIVGGAAGAAAGWTVVPRLLSGSPDRVVVALALLVVGAVLGRLLLPLAGRLSVVVAGFVSASTAFVVFFEGRRVVNRLAGVDPAVTSPREANAVLLRVSDLALLQDQQLLALAAVAGVVGAAVAVRFYDLIVTAAVSAIGAALLSIAIPLWRDALTGRVTLAADAADVSPPLFAVVLVAGVLLQLYRYGDEMNLPWVEEFDPLRRID